MSCHIQYILRLSTYVIRTRVTDKRKSEHYWGVYVICIAMQSVLCAMQCTLSSLTTCLHEFLIPNFNFYQILANQDSGRLVFAMYIAWPKKSENSELGIRENMRWAARNSMYYFKALNYPRFALKLQAESQSKASEQWPHVFVYCLRHLLAKFCRKRKMLHE